MSNDIELKWGTLKGWNLPSEECQKIMERYLALGQNYGAMTQRDTPEQKAIICELIDAVDGEIWLDWDAKHVTKEEAKAYVMEYGKKAATNA